MGQTWQGRHFCPCSLQMVIVSYHRLTSVSPQQNRISAKLTTTGDNAGDARYPPASIEAGEPYTKGTERH